MSPIDVKELKERILVDKKVPLILESLGCNYIKEHRGQKEDYYTATRPIGDNRSSVVVYQNDILTSFCYTEGIQKKDLVFLVEHFKGFPYFSHTIKYICDICGYDYYDNQSSYRSIRNEWDEVNSIISQVNKTNYNPDESLIPIPETVLNKYIHYPHIVFYEDGINLRTQKEFEVCYSAEDRIMFPVRDELSCLVGVKGRSLREEDIEAGRKYFPDYPYPKSKILYGLHKTLPHIKEKKELVIVESEKAVMQLWSYGYKIGVAVGGHILSESQLFKIKQLDSAIVLALDKDVDKEHLKETIRQLHLLFLPLSVVYDKWGLLKDKESPTDYKDVWEELYSKRFTI